MNKENLCRKFPALTRKTIEDINPEELKKLEEEAEKKIGDIIDVNDWGRSKDS